MMEKRPNEEMDLNKLEKVAGGCLFSHSYAPDGMCIRMSDGEYLEWICKDCGAKSYTKDGNDISKEEFDAAKDRFDKMGSQHFVIDMRK